MKIVIQTQTYENYGAHDHEGDGPVPQHWKPKGGDTFICTAKPWDSEALKNIVQVGDDMFRDEIISILFLDEAEYKLEDHCADYQRPVYIEKGTDVWMASRRYLDEWTDIWVRETWIIGKGQCREMFNQEFSKLTSPTREDFLSWDEFQAEEAAA